MKVTHVLYAAAFICQIDPKESTSSTSVSWVCSPYETGDDGLSRGSVVVSSAGGSMPLTDRDFAVMIPVEKTLSRGFVKDDLLNTAPHSWLKLLALKSGEVGSVNNYAPDRRKNYLS